MKRIHFFSFAYVLLATVSLILFWAALANIPSSSPDFDVWAFIYVLAFEFADAVWGASIFDMQFVRAHIFIAALLTATAVPAIALVRELLKTRRVPTEA